MRLTELALEDRWWKGGEEVLEEPLTISWISYYKCIGHTVVLRKKECRFYQSGNWGKPELLKKKLLLTSVRQRFWFQLIIKSTALFVANKN